ncbi:MAG: SGNH/GDSL hydrolase family protein, partial [Verrucomicrobium sp.]|nr:SGNH/GDSL hydrolase family protein [Verrucomicrobium sp.]
YAKMLKRQPVHAVCIGDSVMNMFGYDSDGGNALKAWSGIFVGELADQFLYTGGVRLIRPPKGQPEKVIPVHGPEITLQNYSRGGRMIMHAVQPLTTVAFENRPDLVIVSYGINDANSGLQPEVYRRNVQEVIDLVHAQKSDLILCGPTVIMSDTPEQGMAMTRPYADIMKEVADANGVFYADLGDLAWFMKVDERKNPLGLPKKPATPPDAATAGPAATPADGKAPATPAIAGKGAPSPAAEAPVSTAKPPPTIVNPVAGDYDPDPDKIAMRLFQQVAASMKLRFHQVIPPDWLHPDTVTQRLLGKRVFSELLHGPKVVPWNLAAGTATLDGSGKCALSFRVENPTAEEQTFTVLPLVPSGLRPLDAPSRVTLKAGKKAMINISYERVAEAEGGTGNRSDLLPSQETFLRLPIFITGGNLARIEVVRATVTPVAILWNTGAIFNQENIAELQGRMVNTSSQALEGKWEAKWFGQAWGGNVSIPVKGETLVKMPLRLPTGATAPGRQKGTLNMSVSVGGQVIKFAREIELVRNIGLKEVVPLISPLAYPRDQVVAPPMPSPAIPSVGFRADADSNALYLTWDIFGLNLQDNPGDSALTVDLNLDARSYGKRLGPGSTDFIRVAAAAADGDARVGPLPPWVFGTGYAMYYDERAVKARLSSRPDGSRRFTVTMPRSYLYLHEWALGNGNSQIGINTSLSIWQKGEDGAKGSSLPFVLTTNGRYRDDAESLAVLELTDKPTDRWTVRFY